MKLGVYILAGILAMTAGPVSAQSTPPVELLKPSPLSVIITVGRWITTPDRPKVYYIRVQGRGNSYNQARAEGFKLAVEQAVGSLVASESVVSNSDLVRREIIEYSSGYVDRYNEISSYHGSGEYFVTMDVWVRHSQLASRLLNKSENSRDIDGNRIATQVETLRQERLQGDRLLASVLNDYPNRAFDITNQSMESRFNSYRGVDLTVRFDLNMNSLYVASLYEALDQVSQRRDSEFAVVMTGNHDRALFNRWQGNFGFSDAVKPRLIQHYMMGTVPAVLLVIRDGGGQPIHQGCYFWAELDGQVRHTYPKRQFVSTQYSKIVIDAGFKFTGVVQIQNMANINQARTVDLTVVKSAECPR